MTSIFYFKGRWSIPFNKTATQPEPFFDDNNIKKGDVDMMFQMGFFPYARLPEINSFAVELPYGSVSFPFGVMLTFGYNKLFFRIKNSL